MTTVKDRVFKMFDEHTKNMSNMKRRCIARELAIAFQVAADDDEKEASGGRRKFGEDAEGEAA